MNSRTRLQIKSLQPFIQPRAEAVCRMATMRLNQMKGWRGWFVEVMEGRRSIYKQAGYYSQGRKWDGNRWTITDNKKVVTRTMNSNHLDGNAIDLVLWNKKKGYHWPDPRSKDPAKKKEALRIWHMIRDCVEEVGLSSGARWHQPDYPHAEG